MTHKDWITLMRTLATKHKAILHSDENIAFARIIDSAAPYMKYYSDEFVVLLKSKLKFTDKCMIVQTYRHDYMDARSDNVRKIYRSAFFIMGRIEKHDFTAQEETIDECEQVGEQVLAKLREEFSKPIRDRVFNFNGTGGEAIGPVEGVYVGSKFYVEFEKQAKQVRYVNPENWNA